MSVHLLAPLGRKDHHRLHIHVSIPSDRAASCLALQRAIELYAINWSSEQIRNILNRCSGYQAVLLAWLSACFVSLLLVALVCLLCPSLLLDS
jgi:hypothetical protein